MKRTTATTTITTLGAALLLALAACGTSQDPDDAGGGRGEREVTLVTHDSFAVSDAVLDRFTDETGYTVNVLRGGDAGVMVNQAILSKDNPQGDVLFGVDNNLLARALDGDVFEAYESPRLEAVGQALVLDPEHRATPIDRGDVCLNYDKAFFADADMQPPRNLVALTLPRFRGLTVVENPATSTPGLAFMLATIAEFGDKWQGYWRKLRANDVLVVDGWEEAYGARFSGAAGSKGNRPIVVSYASSPPAEVIFRDPRPARAPTGVVEDSCFRQIELAGILRGAENEEGARELIDFMLSRRFQEDIPLQMFVFPAREDAALPPEFEKFAVVPENPLDLPPAEIEQNRERWVDEWTDIVVR
jgi:thiamine transport system substrate-binding protein